MLGIIGGTGIYELEGLKIIQKHQVDTPFGKASGDIIEGEIANNKIFFLARHGTGHKLLPHEINYQANIYALKKLGVKQIIAFSAVGSLNIDIAPSDFAIASQYFDFVKNGDREKSFFGNGIAAHISTAQPVCTELQDFIAKTAKELDFKIHVDKTYACVDGPRLGTKAESLFLKDSVKADLVGMTNVPEVFLANEAQINYCTIGIVTDYDCWQDDTNLHVTLQQVISRYGESLAKAKVLLNKILEQNLPPINTDKRCKLKNSLLTPIESLDKKQKEFMEVLLA